MSWVAVLIYIQFLRTFINVTNIAHDMNISLNFVLTNCSIQEIRQSTHAKVSLSEICNDTSIYD